MRIFFIRFFECVKIKINRVRGERGLNPKSSIELFAPWADDPGGTAWIVWVKP